MRVLYVLVRPLLCRVPRRHDAQIILRSINAPPIRSLGPVGAKPLIDSVGCLLTLQVVRPLPSRAQHEERDGLYIAFAGLRPVNLHQIIVCAANSHCRCGFFPGLHHRRQQKMTLTSRGSCLRLTSAACHLSAPSRPIRVYPGQSTLT